MTTQSVPPHEEAARGEGFGSAAPAPFSALNEALEYAAAGLRVIPLHDGSKRPRLRRNWPEKATTKRATIRQWFRQWPRANLGITTGRGILVLDVDPRGGGGDSLEQLVAEHGPLPTTAEVRTGSGGSHYYFSVGPDIEVGNRGHFRPGLDIKSDGGQVVAPPSLHPDTGRPYAWVRHHGEGFAPAPDWLLAEAARVEVCRSTGAGTTPTGERDGVPAGEGVATGPDEDRDGRPAIGDPGACPRPERPQARPARVPIHLPDPRRIADIGALLADVKEKFAIPEVGHRHDLMTRAVGSLVGRGYDDGAIVEVMMAWWAYFSALGVVRTGRDEMERELWGCLRSTRSNPNFRPATGAIDREAALATIRLDDRQRALLRSPVRALVADRVGCNGQEGEETRRPGLTNCIEVTRTSDHQCKLCLSADEELFVEALIVQAIYHRQAHPDVPTIRLTDEQIRRIAAARGGRAGRVWDNTQMARLKKKYISGTGRAEASAATRFELLNLTCTGRRGVGRQAATPSVYRPTGIELLIEPPGEAI